MFCAPANSARGNADLRPGLGIAIHRPAPRDATIATAWSEEPICLSRRITSIAPVTPPGTSRIFAQCSASASLRQASGISGNGVRCTETSSPKRAHHASSAVNGSTGASQAVRAAEQNIQQTPAGAAAQRIRPVAIQANPCGYRNRRPRDRWRRNDAAPDTPRSSHGSAPHRQFSRSAPRAGAAGIFPAPGSLAPARLRPRKTRPASRESSAGCCAGGGTIPPAA